MEKTKGEARGKSCNDWQDERRRAMNPTECKFEIGLVAQFVKSGHVEFTV